MSVECARPSPQALASCPMERGQRGGANSSWDFLLGARTTLQAGATSLLGGLGSACGPAFQGEDQKKCAKLLTSKFIWM